MIRVRFCVLFVALSLALGTVLADVKMDEKSQVKFGGMLGKVAGLFGGKAAKEGLVTTVAVKGDRRISVSEDSGQIVDLAEEKVYNLDLRKKTYKVMTFEEMRRELEKARQKAEKQAREAQDEGKKAPEMQIDFDLKQTGQKKAINGFDCSQAIMTITVHEKGKTIEQSGALVMTSDMWITPEIAAAKEIVDFELRYMEKLHGMAAGDMAEQMAQAMVMFPGLGDAFKKMKTENVNLKGTPIQTVTTVTSVPSKEQMAQQQKQEEDSGGGGLLGGFAKRLGRKKSDDQGQAGGGTMANSILTMTTEVLKLATTVAPEDLAIPAGFKQKD